MRLGDWLRWVASAILSNRARSGLTASGIAIGICAVILLTSIGEGIRIYLLDSFSQFGTRIIAITPGRTDTGGSPSGLLSTVRPLSIEDAMAMRRLPHVEAVVPIVQGTARIEAGRYARDSDVIAVGSDMDRAWGFSVASGRFLPPDTQAPRYVAILGKKVREELFRERSPLGEMIRVGGARFRVIGVMAEKGQLLGFDLDDAVYIPAEIGLSLFNRPGLMEVDVVYQESTTAAAMADRARQLIIERHGDDDITIITQEDMLKSLDRVLGMIKLCIGALGSVALLVGGVGVLTIMTMSLRERVQEIGLLRALGCTREQISILFLGEAVVLSAAGGALGMGLVMLLVGLLKLAAPELPVQVQPFYVVLAIGISALIGLLAGLVPALRAAALNPVDALRTE